MFIPNSQQNTLIEHIKNKDEFILALGMGAGKTAISLYILNKWLLDLEVSRVLIVAPLRVARVTWATEIEKWGNLKWPHHVLHGDEKWLSERLPPICMINYEGLLWLYKQPGFFNFFDCIVFDELTAMKNWSSARVKKIKKALPCFKKRFGLTASFNASGYMSVFSMVYCIDIGKRFGTTITGYRKKYFEKGYTGFDYSLKQGAERKIKQKLNDLLFGYSIENVEYTTNVIDVSLPKHAQRIHDQALNNLILCCRDTLETLENKLVALNKCIQITCGSFYESDGTLIDVHTERYDKIKEILDGIDDNVIIVYQFKFQRDWILKNYPETVHLKSGLKISEEREIQQNWDAKKIKYLLIHPKSAGHGLNLQYGGFTMLKMSISYSYENESQVIGRIARQGQTEKVIVYQMFSKNTLEEVIHQVLENREFDVNEILKLACIK